MAGRESLLERGFKGTDLQTALGIHRDDPQVVAAQAQEFDGFADAAMALRAGVDEQKTSNTLQPRGSHVCPQLGFQQLSPNRTRSYLRIPVQAASPRGTRSQPSIFCTRI